MQKLKSFFSSEFSKNVLTLMTGTTISQAIPLAATPILTRIYTPEDFGVLALFSSITAILGLLATGKYEMAILLPKDDKDELNIVYLSVILSAIFSIILFTIVFLFNYEITVLLNEPKISNWLYFVPISVLFIGIYNALNLYNVRYKNFKRVSFSLISKSSGLSITQIGVGLFKSGAFGLVLGQVISFFLGNVILLKSITKRYSIIETFSIQSINQVSKTYIRFPKFTLPGNLMNSISLNALNFFISNFFSTYILGQYSLASRMLGVPSRVFGNSISQVYFQKISASKNEDKNVLSVFNKTLKRLTFISLPIFLILFFIAEPIFDFVFGEEWRIAGTYAKIILPMSAVRFISSALSPTLHVFERQDLTLLIQATQIITLFAIFITVNYLNLSFYNSLVIYSCIYSLEYALFVFIYRYIVLKN